MTKLFRTFYCVKQHVLFKMVHILMSITTVQKLLITKGQASGGFVTNSICQKVSKTPFPPGPSQSLYWWAWHQPGSLVQFYMLSIVRPVFQTIFKICEQASFQVCFQIISNVSKSFLMFLEVVKTHLQKRFYCQRA